jgi:transcriptional regulator with XRE-family HTH domain
MTLEELVHLVASWGPSVDEIEGVELRDLRRRLGLTQVEVARRTGMASTRVSEVEHGRWRVVGAVTRERVRQVLLEEEAAQRRQR